VKPSRETKKKKEVNPTTTKKKKAKTFAKREGSWIFGIEKKKKRGSTRWIGKGEKKKRSTRGGVDHFHFKVRQKGGTLSAQRKKK